MVNEVWFMFRTETVLPSTNGIENIETSGHIFGAAGLK